MTSAPSNRGKKAIALLIAWILIAAACGGQDDDLTVPEDPVEETSDDAQEQSSTEDASEGEEGAVDAEEVAVDEPEDEPTATPTACGPSSQAAAGVAGKFVLHTAETTDCDIPSNRDGSDTAKQEAFIDQKRAVFPDNVVTNPVECSSPSSVLDEPSTWNTAGPLANTMRFADPTYSSYVADELLAFTPQADLKAAIDLIQDQLVSDPDFEGQQHPVLELTELSTAEIAFPGTGPETLYRYKVGLNEDLNDGDFSFDALVWSNLLVSSNIYVRPNYVFTLAPGSQHSPFNEPVPAHTANLTSLPDRLENAAKVAVLDSDWNSGSSDPMRLWAGHMTFVAGVIEQLATGAEILTADFEAGERFTEQTVMISGRPFLTDWAFLNFFVDEGSPLFLDDDADYDVLNLSAGAYSCVVPQDIDPGFAAPPGIVGAATLLQEWGKVLVAAAGNDDLPASDGNYFWPAAAADAEFFNDYFVNTVIAVKAIDSAGQVAQFSNKGPSSALCAPGVDIRSRYPTGEYAYAEGTTLGLFEGAAIWSGTSFAAPHVTAAYVKLLAEEGLDPTSASDRITAIEMLRETFAC